MYERNPISRFTFITGFALIVMICNFWNYKFFPCNIWTNFEKIYYPVVLIVSEIWSWKLYHWISHFIIKSIENESFYKNLEISTSRFLKEVIKNIIYFFGVCILFPFLCLTFKHMDLVIKTFISQSWNIINVHVLK